MAKSCFKTRLSTAAILVFSFLLLPSTALSETQEGKTVRVAPSATLLFDEEDPTSQAIRSEYLINKLKEQLSTSRKKYRELEKLISTTKTQMLNAREDATSLKEQMSNIQDQMDDVETKIVNVLKQINVKETDITGVMDDVDLKTVELEEQKKALGQVIRLLYVQGRVYEDPDGGVSPLKILLADDSISRSLQKATYLQLIENSKTELSKKIALTKIDLENSQSTLEDKHGDLMYLKTRLEEEQRNLQSMYDGKTYLLRETEGKESAFEKILVQALKEEQQSLTDVDSLRDNIDLLSDKVAHVKKDLTPEQYEELIAIKADLAADNGAKYSGEFLQLNWPVAPDLGLSAYFHDAAYQSVFGVDHRAVDIPIAQGSQVAAAADGIVWRAVDNGYGYSYIVVAHRKGVMTLYGHIEKMLVQEGEFVTSGDTIGLSGGTPGTKGAGGRTTGPHVHFEVHQDGILVDPLDYLSLAILPEDGLREDYIEKRAADIAKIEEELSALLGEEVPVEDMPGE